MTMSAYFLPLLSSTSNYEKSGQNSLEHLRQVESERLRQPAPANRSKLFEDFWGNAQNVSFESGNAVKPRGVLGSNVELAWNLDRQVGVPSSYDRSREFQDEQRYSAAECNQIATTEHFAVVGGDLDERAVNDRRKVTDKKVARSDDLVCIQELEGPHSAGPESWPASIMNLLSEQYRFQKGNQMSQAALGELWYGPCDKDHYDVQPCTQWKIARSLDKTDTKNQELCGNTGEPSAFGGVSVADLIRRSQSELDPEAQYRTARSDAAQIPLHVHQQNAACPNYWIRAELPSYCSSQELERRDRALMVSETSDQVLGYVQARQGIIKANRVIRPGGGKDRHSKVKTSKGLRDRRVRLSVATAIQFYDIQDRLGYDQPSKAVDWLLKKAKAAIDELPGPAINASAIDRCISKTSRDGLAVYSATSRMTSSPPASSRGTEHLDCRAFKPHAGLSITMHSDAKNDGSSAKNLQAAKEQQTCALQGADKHAMKQAAEMKMSSSSASECSRGAEIAVTFGSARSESRANARKRARERTIEKNREVGHAGDCE